MMRIVTSIHHTRTIEDWSEVRSPSRAARRMRQGHKQRVRHRKVPADPVHDRVRNVIYMHPETERQLMERAPDA